MIKKLFLLIVVIFLTSSCSIYHVDSNNVSETFYPAKNTEDVVYLESVDRDHEVIGTVIVNGERKQRNMDDVIQKMRREAAILGGDAVTNIQSDATGVWKKLPAHATLKNAYVRANYTASVVVFK